MIYLKNFAKILQHKWFVLIAGLRIGGIPIWRLLIHDLSKFSPAEFGPYARAFLGVRTDETDAEFAVAWLHHENRNPHHWGHWVARSGKYTGKPLAMPEAYAREMVADWWAAGRAYAGSWDMTEWLNKSVDGFPLHHETREAVRLALLDAGYHHIETAGWVKFR